VGAWVGTVVGAGVGDGVITLIGVWTCTTGVRIETLAVDASLTTAAATS